MKFATRPVLLSVAGAAVLAQTAPEWSYREPSFAPPAPPMVLRESSAEPRWRAMAATVYSIGDPTPEEQLYVELVNRARANPQAEALLLANTTDANVLDDLGSWQVDRALMIAQFAAFAAVQPLAINPALTRAARRHSLDMFNQSFQAHDGSDGSTPSSRAEAEGYDIASLGENVYANAESVFHGHAGFEVDWGPGVGGMQTPPGHRNTIHSGNFREIGVGVVVGRNEIAGKQPVGPQLVTQEFGTAQGASPFITGVAYYDLNGNNFYDIGEGIGGVSVQVAGVSATGITALSGGYAVPVSGNGTYTVTFSGAGFSPVTRSVTVSGSLNQKLDFKPAYVAPGISGSVNPVSGRDNAYTIASVPGATEYQWRVFRKIPAAMEGAESGESTVTIDQTAGYSVIQSQLKTSGASAFHLVHPTAGPRPQLVTLKPSFILGAGAELSFQSRLGWAAPDQHARVQISFNDGASWENIYAQAGSGGRGETSFNLRTVSLAQHAGKQARLRLNYDFSSGGFFNQTDAEVGWTVDDIRLANAEQVSDSSTASASASGAFTFIPPAVGSYVLQGRAKTGHAFLPFGPEKSVTAVQAGSTPELRISRALRNGAELQLTIDLLAGTLSSGFALESKASLSDNWSAQAATVQNLSATQFLVKINTAGASRFYRARAN